MSAFRCAAAITADEVLCVMIKNNEPGFFH